MALKRLLVLLTLGCMALFIGCSEPYKFYNFTELEPQPCWYEFEPLIINNNGDVIGNFHNQDVVDSAFLYHNNRYTVLLPKGWRSATATGINDNGDIVGGGEDATGVQKGFLYSNGQIIELLPDGWKSAAAAGINDNGEVIGNGYDVNDVHKGFLYSNGQIIELLPPGWEEAEALRINNKGEVIGKEFKNTKNAFLYSNGQYTALLPPGWESIYVKDINDNGEVVGWGQNALLREVGFLYSNAEYTELLPNEGCDYFKAVAINNMGEVVGEAKVGFFHHAFFYSPATIFKYTELVPEWLWEQYPYYNLAAYDINDNGFILGSSFIAYPSTPS